MAKANGGRVTEKDACATDMPRCTRASLNFLVNTCAGDAGDNASTCDAAVHYLHTWRAYVTSHLSASICSATIAVPAARTSISSLERFVCLPPPLLTRTPPMHTPPPLHTRRTVLTRLCCLP